MLKYCHKYFLHQNVSKYVKEILQSLTADQPKAPRGSHSTLTVRRHQEDN